MEFLKRLFRFNKTKNETASKLMKMSIEETIMDLRQEGKTQKEISTITGLTLNQVKGKIQKLIKEGKIERKYVYTR